MRVRSGVQALDKKIDDMKTYKKDMKRLQKELKAIQTNQDEASDGAMSHKDDINETIDVKYFKLNRKLEQIKSDVERLDRKLDSSTDDLETRLGISDFGIRCFENRFNNRMKHFEELMVHLIRCQKASTCITSPPVWQRAASSKDPKGAGQVQTTAAALLCSLQAESKDAGQVQTTALPLSSSGQAESEDAGQLQQTAVALASLEQGGSKDAEQVQTRAEALPPPGQDEPQQAIPKPQVHA